MLTPIKKKLRVMPSKMSNLLSSRRLLSHTPLAQTLTLGQRGNHLLELIEDLHPNKRVEHQRVELPLLSFAIVGKNPSSSVVENKGDG